MDTYILQVDLPDGSKKGDEYTIPVQFKRTYRNTRHNTSIHDWNIGLVENNPAFFKKKEANPFRHTFTIAEATEIGDKAYQNGLRDGFAAARETRNEGYHPDFEVTGLRKYPTFEAYKQANP